MINFGDVLRSCHPDDAAARHFRLQRFVKSKEQRMERKKARFLV
jgi:hypothetical protein